jgi:peroxiredoxin
MTTAEPRRHFKSTLIAIMVILAVIIGALSLIKRHLPQGGQQEAAIGQQIPDAELKKTGGETIKLSSIRARIIMLNFWASWCDACVAEMPSLIALREGFKDKGFEIAGINVEENPETAIPRTIQQYKITFPVFTDPEQKLVDLFDVHGLPMTVIINNKLKVLHIETGERDWNTPDFRAQLEKWLAE